MPRDMKWGKRESFINLSLAGKTHSTEGAQASVASPWKDQSS